MGLCADRRRSDGRRSQETRARVRRPGRGGSLPERDLKGPERREVGLGPVCQTKVDPDRAERLRLNPRAMDRVRLRRELALNRRAERELAASEEIIRAREQLDLRESRNSPPPGADRRPRPAEPLRPRLKARG